MPDPTPLPPPVWYKSQKFIGFCQSAAVMAVLWALNGLQTNVWDWRAGLAIPVLSSAVVTLRDMWSPTVVGPFATMNKNNAK